MAKRPTVTDVSSGHQSSTTFNDNFDAIVEHFDGFLSRNGDTPNNMEADLDLNSNDILNGGTGNFSSLTVNGYPIAPNVTVTVEGVRPETYAENTTPGTTDMTGAIRSAVAYLKTQGGGDLYLSADTYLISDTITIDSPIRIIGQGWSFLNDYTDDEVLLRGTWITKTSGTDFDMFVFTGDTSLAVSGNYPRVHARMEKVGLHGNKGSTATPTDVDAGAGGSGISCQGASYVSLSDVCVFRCADNGVESTTYAYGGSLGTASSNNLKFHKVYALQNAGNGFSMFGGDSIFSFLVGGFNGLDGFNGNMGPLSGSRFWNNQRRGITVQGNAAGTAQVPPMLVTNNYVYDNLDMGILVSAGEGHIIGNNAIFDNGRDAAETDNDRAGIAISSSADNLVISNNVMGRYNYGGKSGYGAGNQLYGISAVSGTPAVKIASNVYVGHDVWDPADIGNLASLVELNITDKSDMEYHDSLGGDGTIPHPGFQSTGTIDMDSQRLEGVSALMFDSGNSVATVTANVLETSNKSVVVLTSASNFTVNTINSTIDNNQLLIVRNSGSGTTTFTNNASAIRLNSGANVDLTQNQAIMFLKVSSSVWQQVV